MLLQNAQLGRINDSAAEELIGESAKALCKNIDDVVSCSIAAVKTLNDGQKMRDIHGASKQVLAAKEALASTVETLAGSVLDPATKKHIVDSTNSLAGLVAGLCSSVKDSGASPNYLQSIGAAAKNVNDSINQLVGSLDCAEEKGFEEMLDFNGPADRVATAIGEMRLAGNDKQKLMDAVKMIALATNELVAASKMVADSDPESRDRILNTANATADNVTRMVDVAKQVAQNPNDVNARQNLMEAAQRIQGIIQELVVSAGKTASIVNLRTAAKMAASSATNLLSTAREVAGFVDNPQQKQKLIEDVAGTNSSNNQLIDAIKVAARNPSSVPAQNSLLDSATNAVSALAQMVSSAKQSSFNVSDPNKKQALQYAANEMGDRLKDLMQACEAYNSNEGHKEIEEALQQFDAINSSLEAAEFRANSGLLRPGPGQSRDGAKALLDRSFQNLSDSAKEVVLSAKGEGGNLGTAAKMAAESSALVASAVEAVAATTPIQSQQKKILASAKKLNKDIANFITSSRALNGRRGDPVLEQGVAKSYGQLKSSIATVLASASGLDSTELDEASANILSAAAKLSVSSDPLISYSEATENMVNDIKALSAACSQLAGLARSNPSALASASKILETTCNDIVDRASQAAAHVDDVKGREIIEGTQGLLNKVGELLQFAKTAVASKSNENYAAVDNAALDIASTVSELEGVVSGTQNPQIQFATNEILNALSQINDLSTTQGRDVGNVVSEIQRAAGNLAGNSSRLARAARVGTDKLGIYVRETANDVKSIIDTVKSAQKPPTGQQSQQQTLSPEATTIRNAIQQIVNNPTNNSIIVPATKAAATTTAQLMTQAKEIAVRSTDKNKQIAVLRSAKALATATTELARAAKAPKDREGVQNLIQAANNLLNYTMELENAKGDSTEVSQRGSVPRAAATQLTQAAKVLASTANNFLNAVGQLSQNTKDTGAANQLTQASKQYADAIRDMYNSTQLLNPGVIKIKASEREIERAVSDLDQAAIEVQVGQLNPQIAGGKSFPQCQEALVNLCKSFAGDINNLVSVVSQGPEKVGEVSDQISDHIRQLVLVAKAAAATTTDPNIQASLLANAKLLAKPWLLYFTSV